MEVKKLKKLKKIQKKIVKIKNFYYLCGKIKNYGEILEVNR